VKQYTSLVGVRATNNRGFTPEELASQCAQKVVSVADTAPPVIRDQAVAFQKHIEKVVCGYLKQAVHSDRTTVYNALNDAGHPALAELIRKL
tara:strand:- start:6076 stop:6351 length:276 start_codon:yes stop_codon:yes gene_type:complete